LIKLTRLMRKNHYALVHTHSSKAGILGRLAAKLGGVPCIVHTVHGWSYHDYMSSTVRRAYILLERLAARFTDRLIVVTNTDIEKGLANHIAEPQKYILIRSAIPIVEFDPDKVDRRAVRRSLGIAEDCPVLGNIGRFSSQKNPLDWVKIAAQVASEIPDCMFLMVGDGPLRQEAESLMEDLGIRSRVITTGLRRDVPELLSAIDAFLLTSLWEGLPRVLPQAMLMGVPVVAYRSDGVAEAIQSGDTGFLSEPGELTTAANYCRRLLEDAELHRQIAKRARQFATQNFELSVMIAQIEQVYQQLLGFE
jgi:glycosyltransferase involved in cell wall biosynthesis